MNNPWSSNRRKLILSLCDYTGNWAKYYKEANYKVEIIDIDHGQDVRLLKLPRTRVHGILAAPPCTMFASSGARWKRTEEEMIDALSIVDACLRIILVTNPIFWALENPIGKLTQYLGKPRLYFDPSDYGDPYTKRTCLWGNFNLPKRKPVKPTEGSKMHLLPPSKQRQRLRSTTPLGFAKSFFLANK